MAYIFPCEISKLAAVYRRKLWTEPEESAGIDF